MSTRTRPPLASAYRRGRDFEYRVQRRLVAAGWRVVRSAGSHSPADLVAWDPGGSCWLVQAKLARPPSPAERAALVEWAEATDAAAAWVRPAPFAQGLDWRLFDRGRWVRIDDPTCWTVGPANGG